jgi:translocation protein SEC63
MAVPPFHFAKFDQPIIDDEGKPTFNMQTLKAQFAAPPQAGHYTFVLHVICDSYVGFDTKMEVTLVVEEASKAAEMQAEDEISEPEEGKSQLQNNSLNVPANNFSDSLAGQMHVLKTGQTPKTRRRDSDDSEDESGTDEEEDDTSATNTDTEDES